MKPKGWFAAGLVLWWALAIAANWLLLYPELWVEADKQITPYLTRLHYLKMAVWGWFVFGSIVLVFAFFQRKKIKSFLLRAAVEARELDFRLPISLWLLLSAILAYRLFWLFALPLQIDEAFCYVFLVSRGFAVSWAFYPGPNNHILYTLLSLLFKGFGVVVGMRLTTILAATVQSYLLALWIKRSYGIIAASAAILLSICGEYLMLYGVMGRGYALQSLFCLLALWSSSKKNSPLADWVFVMANFFGFFTVPSHLLFYFSIAFYQVFYTGIGLKKALIYHFWVLILTLLAYTPVLTLNSDSFFSNSWLKVKTHPDFLGYLHEAMTANYPPVLGEMALVLLLLAIKNKQVLTAFGIIPWVLSWLLGVQPFIRTWYWKYQLEAIALGIIAGKNRFFLGFIILYVVGMGIWVYWQHVAVVDVYDFLPQAIAKAQTIAPKRIFCEVDEYQVFLRLEYIKQKKSVPKIDTRYDSAIRYDLLILRPRLVKNLAIIHSDPYAVLAIP